MNKATLSSVTIGSYRILENLRKGILHANLVRRRLWQSKSQAKRRPLTVQVIRYVTKREGLGFRIVHKRCMGLLDSTWLSLGVLQTNSLPTPSNPALQDFQN